MCAGFLTREKGQLSAPSSLLGRRLSLTAAGP